VSIDYETDTKLKMVVEIEYESNGTPVNTLRDYLKDAVYSALGEGRMTYETPAVVTGYHYEVEEVE
jgi:hypothetical protein